MGLPVTSRYAYNEHIRMMQLKGKQTVSYQAFCARLRGGWNMKKAIETPSNVKMIRNCINMRPKKSRWQILLDYFKIC